MNDFSNIFVKKRRNASRIDLSGFSPILMSPSTPTPNYDSESSEDAPRAFTDRVYSDKLSYHSTCKKSISESNIFYSLSSFTPTRREAVISLSPQTPRSPNLNVKVCNLHEKIGGLRRAVGIKTEKIIYDTSIDDFDTRLFNSKISCKTNIMILIITQDGHFGCFTEDVIPISNNTNSVISTSRNMFLFTASNKNSTSTTFYYRRYNNKQSLVLYPNCNVDNFFCCYNAFCVDCDKCVYFKQDLHDTYEPTNGHGLFDDLISHSSYCERVIAIEWV
ncbi:TLDc domain-containing protein [Entamoeba marina]